MQTQQISPDVISAEQRRIKRVAILGSGVMGSRIACHFANIGVQVVLLDIVPPEAKDLEASNNNNKEARNKIVNAALKSTLKANPSAIYKKEFANRIITGNFDDDFSLVEDCNWIIEVVIERLDIKQQIFETVEQYRKPGTLITSNTSGIPIHMLVAGRSKDFRAHFCGTHFFNPPRYLKLLEIIPSPDTDQEVIDFLMNFGDLFLGKTTVLCKDTPAFIANRIGVFSIMAIFQIMKKMDLSIEEIDSLTGPISGRPKSATFRTCDVVGLDTLIKVSKGIHDNCPNDEAKDIMKIPSFLLQMEQNGWLGSKSGQGFYKKVKNEKGKSDIHVLDINSLEYKPKQKAKLASVAAAKSIGDLRQRIKTLHETGDKGSQFLDALACQLFSYISHRIPEISDDIYKIDDALKAGFGWEMGPFEYWDLLGVEKYVAKIEANGGTVAQWVKDLLALDNTSFYAIENSENQVYDIAKQYYKQVPGMENFIILDHLRSTKTVWNNSGCSIQDLGDGILNIEFHTKMNAMGGEVLEGISRGIDIAEEEGWNGIVIGNDAANYSAGANLGLIFMMAAEQEFDELNYAITAFQNIMMRVRYSSIPIVGAPHGLTLGGGCELTMHTDAAVVAAETYIGLVEVGVGVIPAGGGTKETVLRISDAYYSGDPKIPLLSNRFTNIATAKVATSGHEGFDIGVLDSKKDIIVVNQTRQMVTAKRKAMELAANGYIQPIERNDITVLGKAALGALYAGAEGFHIGQYASEHDLKIAKKLAYVMAGGNLSAESKVSEQYLLDLEREAFLSLLGEPKTLERIQSVLTSGKPIRN